MRWLAALRARIRLLFGRRAAESRMEEEFRFHLDMETERLEREGGVDPAEARRRARVAFGGEERHREALRDGRGLAWLNGLSLDFKLGLRMLVKYPGLTIVGGLAMAFAVWAGTVTFVIVSQFLNPTVPLPDGDRIVQIRNWDAAAASEESRSLSDYLVWQQSLRSVTELGAWRNVTRNLVVGDVGGRPVQGAEISATAFRVAPEPPLLGRVLLPEDARPSAPPVVVLGYELWQARFAGDPGVVGRTVRLGGVLTTVVGVMPEGFGFPVSHELWTPLRPESFPRAPREGPSIEVFGRLAPGATLADAQAELTAIGQRMAAQFADTHEHLQPRVARYAEPVNASPDDFAAMLSINVFAVLLLALICSNVALLVFARAATREAELVTRSALGASRARILMQLFVEALLLGGVAAMVGLGAAQLALRQWGVEFLERNTGPLPFWFDVSLSPMALLYACGLTLLGAAIAGILPARKVARGLSARMKEATAGSGGVRFGGVWTAVIVVQVAFTVAFPVIVFVERQEVVRLQSLDMGFAAEEYLAVELEMDGETGADAEDEAAVAERRVAFERTVAELRRRVEDQPEVTGVTFVDRLPRDYHRERWIDLEEAGGVAAGSPNGRRVNIASIDPSYFEVLETPVLAGRPFATTDLRTDAHVAIVDEAFVELVLHGRNPVGQRVRISPGGQPVASGQEDTRPWYEIVGVADDLGMTPFNVRRQEAGLYLPAEPGSEDPLQMLIHVQGDPMTFAARLHEMAAAVDPTLRLSSPQRADQSTNDILWIMRLWLRVTVVLTALALLLSLAGIYAVLSYTVARRTREIGVRVALGANRRRVVAAIFRRPIMQVVMGIMAGFILVTAVAWFASGHQPDGAPRLPDSGLSLAQVTLLALHATGMLAVCLLACVVPTRRALRVEPITALRTE